MLKDLVPLFMNNSIGRMSTNAIITSNPPMKEAVASLNWEVKLTISVEAVYLTPPTISVAPVSPKERAKARTDPEKMAGIAKGKSMFLNVVKELAPNVLDATSKVGSIDINFVSNVRTM